MTDATNWSDPNDPLALDRCPFCEATASYGVVDTSKHDPDFGGHFIQCDSPKCHGCIGLRFPNGDDPRPHLRDAWNTRALPPITDAMVERAATAIYDRYDFGAWVPGEKPAWVPGGNSDMQELARYFARAALTAAQGGEA